MRDPTKKCTHRCPITLERRLIEEVCNYLKAKPGTHLLSRVADVDEIRAAANELKAITYQRLKWIPFLKKHSDTFTLSGLDRPGLETVSLHQTASQVTNCLKDMFLRAQHQLWNEIDSLVLLERLDINSLQIKNVHNLSNFVLVLLLEDALL